MTISNTIRTAGPFIGNGITTAFPFTFKVFKKEEVLAVQTDVSTGVATPLVLNSGYSVVLNADQNANPGGTATMVSPLATGQTLVLTSDLAYLQPLEITNGGGFYPSVLNAALDRLTIFCQQLFSLARRSIKFPLSDAGMNTELPSAVARANKLLGFDSDGRPIMAAPISGSAADVAFDLANFQATLYMQTYAAIRAYAGIAPYLDVYTPGIAGRFIRTADVTSADDGGIILVAANGVRWKRLFTGKIEVDWFGAFGVADSKPAITLAIAAADSVQANIAFRAGATYTLASGITWNSTRVGMDGRGCTLATNFASGIFLAPTQSGIDVNERIGAAANHIFQNFNLVGPGFSNVNVVAIRIEDMGADAVNAGNVIRNVAFKAFSVNLQYGRGCFCTLVELCNFQGTQGAGIDTVAGIQIEAAVNSGERNIFRSCFIGGRRRSFDQNNGNADTYFDGCSFVFCGEFFALLSSGVVVLDSCHIEADTDIARWFQVSGSDSSLTVLGGLLIYGGAKQNFAPFYSDVTCTNGGVDIRNLVVKSGGRPVTRTLIDGEGRALGDGIQFGFGDNHQLTSNYSNLLSYPSFESLNYTSDWALGGTVQAVRTNTITPHTGAYSLLFAPLPGNPTPSNATTTVPCKAGQFAACEFWYLTLGVAGTGGTFYGVFNFIDRAGNSIGTVQQVLAVVGNVADWTQVLAYLPTAAPQGTYSVSLSFSLFGTASGTPKGYLDDVIITVS